MSKKDNTCHIISPEEYHRHFLDGEWVEGYKLNAKDYVTDDLYQAYTYKNYLYFCERDETRHGHCIAYKKCHLDNLEMYGLFYKET